MDPASEPPEDQRPAGGAEPPRSGDGGGRRIALNTAIFSIATGFSRVAGLVREIVAARYFGTTTSGDWEKPGTNWPSSGSAGWRAWSAM